MLQIKKKPARQMTFLGPYSRNRLSFFIFLCAKEREKAIKDDSRQSGRRFRMNDVRWDKARAKCHSAAARRRCNKSCPAFSTDRPHLDRHPAGDDEMGRASCAGLSTDGPEEEEDQSCCCLNPSGFIAERRRDFLPLGLN